MLRNLVFTLLLAIAAASFAYADIIKVEPKFAQNFAQPALRGETVSTEFHTHTYATRDKNPLQLFVFSEAKNSDKPTTKAAILLFHSGGWVRGRPEWLFSLAKQFSQQGLIAIPVQYRLSNEKTTPIDALEDACDAFRWVREHARQLRVDPERIVGWGASAGGYLAAATATAGCGDSATQKINGAANALILVSAGIDTEQSAQFRRLVGEGVDLKRYSPIANLKTSGPAALLIAGEEDSVTPLSNAQAYCKKATTLGSQCSLISYANLGHLLTRDLADQRSTVNPDPEIEALAYNEQLKFLKHIGYIPTTRN